MRSETRAWAVGAVLGWLLLTASDTSGLSRSNVGPLHDISEINVEVLIGDPISFETTASTRLFREDRLAAGRFSRELEGALGELLREAGIEIVEEGSPTLSVEFFGGQFPRIPGENVVLISVSVCRAEEDICAPDREVLEVVPEAELAPSLLRIAKGIVADFVMNREAAR